jgi:hypothetical protein
MFWLSELPQADVVTNHFAPPVKWSSAGFRGQRWYIGDFNGDGEDDIFRPMDLLRLENVYGGAEVLVVDGSQVFTGSGLDGFSFGCGTNRVVTG